MKKIKEFTILKFNGGYTVDDSYLQFNIGYIKDKNTNCIEFYSVFSSCRAYITDAFRTIIREKKLKSDCHSLNLHKYNNIKLKNLLLNLCYRTDIEHIIIILKIINYYNIVGKIPKFKLIGKTINDKFNIWHIKIPGLCIRTPFLTSMFTLLIRILCTIPKDKLEKLKNIEDLENYLLKCKNKNSFSYTDTNSIYKNNNYLKYKQITTNHKKLFYGFGKKKLFPLGIEYGFHDTSGINSLCLGKTFNKKLNQLSKELV